MWNFLKEKWNNLCLSYYVHKLLNKPEYIKCITMMDYPIAMFNANKAVNYLTGSSTCPSAFTSQAPKSHPWLDFAVYVNNAFFTLDEEEQIAVLYHELGHYLAGHLNQPENANNYFIRKQWEEVADIFATCQGYNVPLLSALGKMLPHIKDAQVSADIQERMNNLANYLA